MNILEANKIVKHFGGIVALNELSLSVEKNAVIGLIGPNGSGKTTFINLITGFHRIDQGNLFFNGEKLNGLKPNAIARIGIGRTFQETRVFRKMTVTENMLTASLGKIDAKCAEKASELLKLVELFDLRNENAGNLSYGQQKLLELARVLMLNPELLLLDEPTAGINPVLIDKMLNHFRLLRKQGKTLIIVEHNVPLVSDVCERVVVLDHGQKIAEGTPQEIQSNRLVQDAYLGGG